MQKPGEAMDHSLGWQRLLAAFINEAKQADKCFRHYHLQSNTDLQDYKNCYRIGEVIDNQPVPRQLLEYGYRFIYIKNEAEIELKEQIFIG